jgi:hypothetical protein
MRISLAIAAAVLLAAPAAHAFCRTTTVPPPPDYFAPQCWSQGLPLYHASACLPYRLLAKESPIIPNAVLSEKLARAFTTWSTPNSFCSPGIAGIELAPSTDEVLVGYRTGERNNNLVGVVPVWTHPETQNTLALSTLTFNSDTGEIYDVDLEINGTIKWSFTEEAPPADGFDLQSALTHEAGHMLGLAHSPILQSTMFANYTAGSIEPRTLHADDEEAICSIYPNRVQRNTAAGTIPASACNLSPGTPAPQGCDPDITHGCTFSPATPAGFGALFVTAGIAVVALRRRDRSARGSALRPARARPRP